MLHLRASKRILSIRNGRRTPGRRRWLAFLRSCAVGLVTILLISHRMIRYSSELVLYFNLLNEIFVLKSCHHAFDGGILRVVITF